ncbi:GNAT family N-acetyltransferase [Paenibacillus sp. R14(2021)]|uniref:GNAT family N-acetyltransferase n=1 Tax=Paenibacillus sp. R14(2021) TaxID=2859228 RepID=UPI001C616272|nr:GNAT family N-acetyltransferase [Paenibacillus sp. R14(2021)]
MEAAMIAAQIELIQRDHCVVHSVKASMSGDALILYSPVGRCDLHARIVYACGIATKRHVNDLSMFVSENAAQAEKVWQLQYIRILGDKINRGYGSIMMMQLIQRAVDCGVDRIEGSMQLTENKEHRDRLLHFYAKFGFTVDAQRNLRWESSNSSQPRISNTAISR